MIGSNGLNVERLLSVFQDNLQKEERYHPSLQNLTSRLGEDEIGFVHRDRSVVLLLQLHRHSGFHPETFALSINLLDRFLSAVKARVKYLSCISVSCYFLAAKMLEEDENVPSASDMVTVSGCGCSPGDLLRMERVILDKLKWDLHVPTALDFLQVLHAICVARGYLDVYDASLHLKQITMQLECLLSQHKFSLYKPSVLALALLSCELSLITTHWLQATVELVKQTDIEDWELSKCRNKVMDHMEHVANVRQHSVERSLITEDDIVSPDEESDTDASETDTDTDSLIEEYAVSTQDTCRMAVVDNVKTSTLTHVSGVV